MEISLFLIFTLIVLSIIQIIIAVYSALKSQKGSQEDISKNLIDFKDRLEKNEGAIRDEFSKNRDELIKTLTPVETKLSSQITNITGIIDNKMQGISKLLEDGLKNNREELSKSIKDLSDWLTRNLTKFSEHMNSELKALAKETKDSLENNRSTVERKLQDIQKDNNDKLELMRRTVDEKLHDTLEKRLNDSFQLVNNQLEKVQKGLGEMQTLATGVGDLKKVLTNVSQRGNFGENQLGSILELILAPDQFEKQAIVNKETSERVDYVIKLPNKNERNEPLLLPVDSKFPLEDYQRLVEAYEGGISKEEIKSISGQFESTIKKEAKRIKEKYINSPMTTPFALMFVPTEGLFAEIIKRNSLCVDIYNDYRITVVGPTNFSALLNSLKMGFDTLGIEKQSNEILNTLNAVKTGFRNFGEALANTKKKLISATKEIDNVETKSRTIERKLKSFEGLPASETFDLLGDLEFNQDEESE
ncbi:MAG: DNA recombination protein RmuC [Treponema sp.]|jgi:DNA recombination protein RmuC|nr:DNA recombination protein RmuC [Treponema sp.]